VLYEWGRFLYRRPGHYVTDSNSSNKVPLGRVVTARRVNVGLLSRVAATLLPPSHTAVVIASF